MGLVVEYFFSEKNASQCHKGLNTIIMLNAIKS